MLRELKKSASGRDIEEGLCESEEEEEESDFDTDSEVSSCSGSESESESENSSSESESEPQSEESGKVKKTCADSTLTGAAVSVADTFKKPAFGSDTDHSEPEGDLLTGLTSASTAASGPPGPQSHSDCTDRNSVSPDSNTNTSESPSALESDSEAQTPLLESDSTDPTVTEATGPAAETDLKKIERCPSRSLKSLEKKKSKILTKLESNPDLKNISDLKKIEKKKSRILKRLESMPSQDNDLKCDNFALGTTKADRILRASGTKILQSSSDSNEKNEKNGTLYSQKEPESRECDCDDELLLSKDLALFEQFEREEFEKRLKLSSTINGLDSHSPVNSDTNLPPLEASKQDPIIISNPNNPIARLKFQAAIRGVRAVVTLSRKQQSMVRAPERVITSSEEEKDLQCMQDLIGGMLRDKKERRASRA